MEKILHLIQLGIPEAATVWLQLLILAAFSAAGLFAYIGRDLHRETPTIIDPAVRRARLVARADELARHAEQLSTAAELAATTAQRRRSEWLAQQDQVEAAWQEFEVADAIARRLSASAALPAPRPARTPAESADHERYLHRAAMTACAHNELSVLDLSDALAHRRGWNPRRHPVMQELMLRRAVRDGRFAAYRRAAEHERSAWHQVQMAAEEARALQEQALAAKQQVLRVQRRLASAAPTGRPSLLARTALNH